MISHASFFCIYVCVIYDIFIWPVVGQSAVFASRMSNARRHPNGRIHVGKYEPLHLAGVYTGSPPPPATAIRKLMETHPFHQRFDLSIVHNNSLRWLRMRGTSPTMGRDISSVNQRSLGNPAKLSSQLGVAWGLAAKSGKIWQFWVKHATSCTKQRTKMKSTSGSGAFQSFGVPGPPITQHGNGKKHNLEWENHRWKLPQHANSKRKSLFTICSCALSWWRGSTLWKFCWHILLRKHSFWGFSIAQCRCS